MTSTHRALVVGDSAGLRRAATLLALAGWAVFESAAPGAARRATARLRPELVVTDLRLRGGYGPDLVRQLRRDGCAARFFVVTRRPGARVRAELAAQGIDWLTPADPRALFAHLRTDVPEPRDTEPVLPVRDVAPATPVVHDDGDAYDADLPHQVSAIVTGMHEGDVEAVAAAALDLATASFEAGHTPIATLCNAIAADAYRGTVSHARLMQLLVATSAAESWA